MVSFPENTFVAYILFMQIPSSLPLGRYGIAYDNMRHIQTKQRIPKQVVDDWWCQTPLFLFTIYIGNAGHGIMNMFDIVN